MQEVVTFETVLEGSVETFDEDAFKTSLAVHLDGVNEADINLNVTSASVVVVATIATESHDAAVNAATQLNQLTPVTLQDILGVTVVSIQQATISYVTVTNVHHNYVTGSSSNIVLIIIGERCLRSTRQSAELPSIPASCSTCTRPPFLLCYTDAHPSSCAVQGSLW